MRVQSESLHSHHALLSSLFLETLLRLISESSMDVIHTRCLLQQPSVKHLLQPHTTLLFPLPTKTPKSLSDSRMRASRHSMEVGSGISEALRPCDPPNRGKCGARVHRVRSHRIACACRKTQQFEEHYSPRARLYYNCISEQTYSNMEM